LVYESQKIKKCKRCKKEFYWKDLEANVEVPKNLREHIWKRKRYCTHECQKLADLERIEKNTKWVDEWKDCKWCGEKFQRNNRIPDNAWKIKKFCNTICYTQVKAATVLARELKIPLPEFRDLLLEMFENYHKDKV